MSVLPAARTANVLAQQARSIVSAATDPCDALAVYCIVVAALIHGFAKAGYDPRLTLAECEEFIEDRLAWFTKECG